MKNLSQLLRTRKAIAMPPNCLDITRAGWVFFNFQAQPANVHIQSAWISNPIIAPYLCKQLLPAESAPGVFHQTRQQIELTRGQLHLGLVLEYAPGYWVQG